MSTACRGLKAVGQIQKPVGTDQIQKLVQTITPMVLFNLLYALYKTSESPRSSKNLKASGVLRDSKASPENFQDLGTLTRVSENSRGPGESKADNSSQASAETPEGPGTLTNEPSPDIIGAKRVRDLPPWIRKIGYKYMFKYLRGVTTEEGYNKIMSRRVRSPRKRKTERR